MPQHITTESGSVYVLDDDGCVTRLSEKPISNWPHATFDKEPTLQIDGAIVVGSPFRFMTFEGWFRTSPVTAIESS